MGRVKASKPTYPVFADRNQVDQALFDLGECQRELTFLRGEVEQRVAEIHAAYAPEYAALAQESADLVKGIEVWCNAHRDELTDDNRTKTVLFGNGKVEWRFTPWSVLLKGKVAAEVVIAKLKTVRLQLENLELPSFVRAKEEVNREMLLEYRETLVENQVLEKLDLPIGFSQTEEFAITPVEATETTIKLK